MSITNLSREDILIRQIAQIGRDLKIEGPITLQISLRVDSIPYAQGKSITVPYLFLFQSEDLPTEFRIKSFDDPKLDDDEFLNGVLQWTRKVANIDDKSPITPFEKYTIRSFLAFLRDEKESENGKTFVLRHEAGHLLHRHNHDSGNPVSLVTKPFFTKYTILIALLIVLGSCLFAFLLATPPGWIVAAAIAIYVSAIAIQIFLRCGQSISCEKQADLTAVRGCEEARTGGIYLFDTLREINRRERHKIPYGKLLFSPSGNTRAFYLTHPTESQRIARFQKEAAQTKRTNVGRGLCRPSWLSLQV